MAGEPVPDQGIVTWLGKRCLIREPSPDRGNRHLIEGPVLGGAFFRA
ncbi:MAG: hypothetical protein NC541_11955 [bacterium]|nr:hypothetical protein [bacterium]